MFKAKIKIKLENDSIVELDTLKRDTYKKALEDCEISKSIWENRLLSYEILEV